MHERHVSQTELNFIICESFFALFDCICNVSSITLTTRDKQTKILKYFVENHAWLQFKCILYADFSRVHSTYTFIEDATTRWYGFTVILIIYLTKIIRVLLLKKFIYNLNPI